jgi:hypothetical protein
MPLPEKPQLIITWILCVFSGGVGVAALIAGRVALGIVMTLCAVGLGPFNHRAVKNRPPSRLDQAAEARRRRQNERNPKT